MVACFKAGTVEETKLISSFFGSVAEWFEASFLWRPSSQVWWFNSHPSLVVASLDKMLYYKYLCLVESNKQQNEEVKSKIHAENSETRLTPKRVWNRPMHSASVAFSWQEDTNEEIKIKKTFCIFCSNTMYGNSFLIWRINFLCFCHETPMENLRIINRNKYWLGIAVVFLFFRHGFLALMLAL